MDEGYSRNNHSRLQAVELLSLIVKEAQKNEEAQKKLIENFSLITQVIVKVVETAETWQKQKVKKTI